MKQMYDFIPVYVACGGTELDAMDYIVARKVLKKFESMNVSFVRDEITGLINYIEKTFGKAGMEDSQVLPEKNPESVLKSNGSAAAVLRRC